MQIITYIFLAGSPPNLTSSLKSGHSNSGGGSQTPSSFVLTAASTPSPVKSSLKLPLSTRVSRKRNNYGGSRAITFCAGSFNNR